jgi:thioredoxin 1
MDKPLSGLSPVAREKLDKLDELSAEERSKMHDIENLNALLSVYFKGILDGNILFTVLKEAEERGQQHLVRSAKGRLEGSFMEAKLPFRFNENSEGILSVETINGEVEMEKEKGPVIELNGKNFEDALKNNSSLVVDCWAPWCGPCRMMSPVIDELAADYKGKISFAKLNTDENQDLATKYQVQAIPTLLIFKDGKLADRKVGAMPKKLLQAELDKTLG